jgi:hypothetical protein
MDGHMAVGSNFQRDCGWDTQDVGLSEPWITASGGAFGFIVVDRRN